MRFGTVLIVSGAMLLGAVATPPALLAGAVGMQRYAPDTLRYVVNTTTGLTQHGFSASEMRSVEQAMANFGAWLPSQPTTARERVTADQVGTNRVAAAIAAGH